MKNTKELFIRLYIGTLYSNFIVPLRGSNYIQLLYGDLQQLLIFLLERQIRWLVWQERINEVGQILVKTWSIKTQEGYNADTTELGKSTLKKICQRYPKGMPKFGKFNLKRLHQGYTKATPEFGLFSLKQLLQLFSNASSKIGSIRINSGQKIGVNRCKSVRILTNPGTKMRVNECKWVQKIGTNRDRSGRKTRVECDQMLPNATRKQGDQKRPNATNNDLLTYQRLILLNNLFMFCVGQKLL
jgi:hypothetical protein